MGNSYHRFGDSPSFGGKKIPELMRGLGKGVRSFKDGMSDVEKQINDIDNDADKPSKTDSK